MTYDEKKNISIIMQVCYKKQSDMQDTRMIAKNTLLSQQEFSDAINNDYQMLTGLIERAQKVDELSNLDREKLEKLILSSTLDTTGREAANKAIQEVSTMGGYRIIKAKLLLNQQNPIKEKGFGSAKEIQEQLNKDLKDPKK